MSRESLARPVASEPNPVASGPNPLAALLPFALLGLALCAEVWGRAGAVSSPARLEEELWIRQPGLQPMYDQPPFRYRILFRTVVDAVTAALGGGEQGYTHGGPVFWQAFLLVSVVAWLLALAGVRALLQTVGLRGWQTALGAIAFVAAFPVIQAYGFPTHTREDPLAYACMAWGLVFWLRGALLPFVLTAMVGVATRETLLTLAIVHVVNGPLRELWRRLLHTAPIALVAVAVRLGMGWERHSLASSLDNLHSWKETVLCTVLAFGCLWPHALLALRARVPAVEPLSRRLQDTWRIVLPLTLASVLVGGIMREMRLMFLIAPWALVFATRGAAAGRTERQCRTATLVGAAALIAGIVAPWWWGDTAWVGGDGALAVYGRPSWLLLAAWHVGAAGWAFWPRVHAVASTTPAVPDHQEPSAAILPHNDVRRERAGQQRRRRG